MNFEKNRIRQILRVLSCVVNCNFFIKILSISCFYQTVIIEIVRPLFVEQSGQLSGLLCAARIILYITCQ